VELFYDSPFDSKDFSFICWIIDFWWFKTTTCIVYHMLSSRFWLSTTPWATELASVGTSNDNQYMIESEFDSKMSESNVTCCDFSSQKAVLGGLFFRLIDHCQRASYFSKIVDKTPTKTYKSKKLLNNLNILRNQPWFHNLNFIRISQNTLRRYNISSFCKWLSIRILKVEPARVSILTRAGNINNPPGGCMFRNSFTHC